MSELRLLDGHRERYRENLIWLQEDGFAKPEITDPQLCAQAHVLKVSRSTTPYELLTVDYQTESKCPLVLSLNYSSLFTMYLAPVSQPEQLTRLEASSVFPAYGSLTAALVPPGTGRLYIRLSPALGLKPRYLSILISVVLLISALIFGHRSSHH
jgi:hypothetical protein